MKDIQKILGSLPSSEYTLIEHAWGQNAGTVYNLIVAAWNGGSEKRIFVRTRKKYGMRSMVEFLREQGLQVEIIGKEGDGEDGRLIEIERDVKKILAPIKPNRMISFSFRKKVYAANVGNAIFSKKKLDDGTTFLLETFLTQVSHSDEATIGDLGAGWGAMSVVLADTLPHGHIIAFEKEPGALEACRENLKSYSNTELVDMDLTQVTSNQTQPFQKKFDDLISNFSFHVTTTERDAFFKTAKAFLKPAGCLYIVAEGKFVTRCEQAAKKFFDIKERHPQGRYVVFVCG